MSAAKKIGAEALAEKGWLASHKWLILRRISQLAILALFLVGPLAGLWIVKGNLAYSLTLNTLPLADPYVLLQSLLAGHIPEKMALIGVAIVLAFYFLVGGRVYCSWVCPVNMVTDAAAWLRGRFGIKGGAHISRKLRYWVLGMTLVLAAVTGTIAWELINPVSMLHRGLIFGIGMAWAIVLAVFLLDLFVSANAWCGHVCPVGAFYSLLGKWSPLRVSCGQARSVQRLHGLLRGLPRAAGDQAGAEGGETECRPGHPLTQLHQLRALHRRVLEGRIPLRAAQTGLEGLLRTAIPPGWAPDTATRKARPRRKTACRPAGRTQEAGP